MGLSDICAHCERPKIQHVRSRLLRPAVGFCPYRPNIFEHDTSPHGRMTEAFRRLCDAIGECAEDGQGIEVGELNKLIVDHLQVPAANLFNHVAGLVASMKEDDPRNLAGLAGHAAWDVVCPDGRDWASCPMCQGWDGQSHQRKED